MTAPSAALHRTDPLPLGRLALLAAAGFLTMLTETVPAGLLPAMGRGLGSADAVTGQLLTAYAGASTLAAIPLVAATSRVQRTPLVLGTILVVALANLITAAAPVFWLAVAARVLGGAAAALQWALLAGFAMRMVRPERQGRALSIAMCGIPLALAAGVPLGAFLGEIVGWRAVFAVVAAVGVLIALTGSRVLPAVGAGQGSAGAPWTALRRAGILAVLLGAGAFQLGHMALYTYVAPFLAERTSPLPVSTFLLVLGVSAVAGLFLTGVVIDRHLAVAALAAMAFFAAAMLLLALTDAVPPVLAAAVLWGLGLGAAPTIFQTACARVAGPRVDQAQSLLVTVFNAGMAMGSALGGTVLAGTGSALPLPWLCLVLFLGILALLLVTARRSLPREAVSLTDHDPGDLPAADAP